MKEYKNTLNLPKTDFPMKANLAAREPKMLEKWQSINLFEKICEKNKDNPKFVFHDGPPYANGKIHTGHAVNKTLKDMVVKSKILGGFNSVFVPGWDCHGLPIELNVEKKVGKPGHKVTHQEFRTACRTYAKTQVDIQLEAFKRLGVIADWDNPYLTMDFNYEANIIRSLGKILANNHIQKGEKPVYWCLNCASALAEAEVEYKDKTSPQIDVRFKVIDKSKFLNSVKNIEDNDKPIYVPIWTTTPWTLPSNQAVALNPYIEYALVETKDERLLIAESLVDDVCERYEITDHKILGKALGSEFELQELQHPFFDKKSSILMAEFVTTDAGTGAVHTAGSHGPDDYVLQKKYNIELVNYLGNNGCFAKDLPIVGGMHVAKTDDLIIETLKENNNLIHISKMSHSYPHCWRHKTPLIYRATPQWFISMDKNKLREMALIEAENVHWVPEWGQNRFVSMIENRPDWCISRQRSWGVPIPFFLHKDTDELHPDNVALIEKVAKKVDEAGIDVWFESEVSDWLSGDDAVNYKKCTDTLDVWFDSGVTNECVMKQRKELGFPADLYLEGSDQHRGWFQSSLLTSLAINGHKPYKTVLTHGFMIDGNGRKMSKSIGNTIEPDEITKVMGADVLRLWVASADYRGEISLSKEILTRASDTYRRLRNTARFLLANLEGFDPEKHIVKPEEMLTLDRYIVEKARRLQKEIIAAYDAYQFHLIYQKIHQFCSIDLGSFYLDIIKDRQYTTKTSSLSRRSTQTAMYHISEALVRWIAPILSFTADEVWQYLPGKRNESVFLNTWYKDLAKLPDDLNMNFPYWEVLRAIRDAVNKQIEELRNSGDLGSALEANVDIYCEAKLKESLDLLGDELRFLLITSKANVHLANSHMDKYSQTDVPGMWLSVAPVKYEKCERCWHRSAEVGKEVDHPTLCARCIANVDGEGEVRRFV